MLKKDEIVAQIIDQSKKTIDKPATEAVEQSEAEIEESVVNVSSSSLEGSWTLMDRGSGAASSMAASSLIQTKEEEAPLHSGNSFSLLNKMKSIKKNI